MTKNGEGSNKSTNSNIKNTKTKEIKSMMGLVLKVSKQSKRAMDNDRALLARVWAKQSGVGYQELFEFLNKVDLPETITRARRKLHQQGKISYSPKVEEARYNSYREVKENI